jgi:uncharacterized protein with PIN domain
VSAAALEDLDARMIRLLKAEHPFAYCDKCLAALLLVPADSAEAAVQRLAADPERFQRISRMCYRCRRTMDVLVLNA